MLNNLVAQALAAAGVPVAKQPVGLVRQDGKRADGLMLIPFEGGRSLTCDVTVVCSTADSHIDLTMQGPGCVMEMAVSRKETKYATLRTHYDFQPIAVETLGPINESATSFLYDLGRQISLVSGEEREPQFLFQRISVAIQRFNMVLLHDGCFVFRPPGLLPAQDLIFFINFSFLGNKPTEVKK